MSQDMMRLYWLIWSVCGCSLQDGGTDDDWIVLFGWTVPLTVYKTMTNSCSCLYLRLCLHLVQTQFALVPLCGSTWASDRFFTCYFILIFPCWPWSRSRLSGRRLLQFPPLKVMMDVQGLQTDSRSDGTNPAAASCHETWTVSETLTFRR